jgi:hypothetical protein
LEAVTLTEPTIKTLNIEILTMKKPDKMMLDLSANYTHPITKCETGKRTPAKEILPRKPNAPARDDKQVASKELRLLGEDEFPTLRTRSKERDLQFAEARQKAFNEFKLLESPADKISWIEKNREKLEAWDINTDELVRRWKANPKVARRDPAKTHNLNFKDAPDPAALDDVVSAAVKREDSLIFKQKQPPRLRQSVIELGVLIDGAEELFKLDEEPGGRRESDLEKCEPPRADDDDDYDDDE